MGVSRYLLAVKPWTFVKAHQVLRMDIPTLGIDGTCLSIIGQLGENRRVLIFPSFDGFERFLAAANAGRREHGAITMGTELLSLTFQHAAESPPSMYCEAMGNASSRRTSEQAPTQRASSGSRAVGRVGRRGRGIRQPVQVPRRGRSSVCGDPGRQRGAACGDQRHAQTPRCAVLGRRVVTASRAAAGLSGTRPRADSVGSSESLNLCPEPGQIHLLLESEHGLSSPSVAVAGLRRFGASLVRVNPGLEGEALRAYLLEEAQALTPPFLLRLGTSMLSSMSSWMVLLAI